MSKVIIKKKENASDVTPFSFESFDRDPKQVLVEDREEERDTLPEEDQAVKVSPEEQMEVFRPPDIEEIIVKRLNEIEREAQEIKNQAFEEGRSEGYRVGYEQGMEDARRLAEQIRRTLESIRELPVKIMKDYREWLIEAAFSIAKHIIQEELSTKPQTFLSMISRLIKEMEEDLPVTIFLHPEDVSLLRLGVDFEEWANLQGKTLKLEEDSSLERGSCRLESDVSFLDATLDRVLNEMKRELFMESPSLRIENDENHK